MHAYTQQALGAYQTVNRETLSPRAIEYRVFAQVTSRMENAKGSDDPLGRDFNQALTDNILLWNAIAADVATETNGLPQALRTNLFSLSQFMTQHTKKVRHGEASMDAMIEINHSIMAGLMPKEETNMNNNNTGEA